MTTWNKAYWELLRHYEDGRTIVDAPLATQREGRNLAYDAMDAEQIGDLVPFIFEVRPIVGPDALAAWYSLSCQRSQAYLDAYLAEQATK